MVATQQVSSSVIEVNGYTQIQAEIFSQQAGTFTANWYADSAKQYLVRTFSRPYTETGSHVYLSSPTYSPFYQYSFTNGAVSSSFAYVGTKLFTKAISGQIIGLNDFIPQNVIANLGRNVIVGQDTAGNFRNVPVDTEGHIRVNIDEPTTMFGTLAVDEMTPIAQIRFPYGINSDLVSTSSVQTGAIFHSQSMAFITSGTSSLASSSLSTITRAIYRPGQGITVRFAGYFITGSANDKI